MDIKREKENILKIESLVNNGMGQEALNIIEKLQDEFSDSFQIKFIKAKALVGLQKNMSAEVILKELEKTHKDNINLLKLQSDFYEKINKNEIALDYLKRLNFIDPFNNEIKQKIEKINIQIERKKMTADTLPESKIKEYAEEEEIDFSINESSDSEDKKNDEIVDKKEVDEDDFATMSAAEIYIKQGLYEDALNILEKVYKREQSEEINKIIINIKRKISIKQKIKILNGFMDIIKEKGDSFV